MTLWRVRVSLNGWTIHLLSETKPFLDNEGKVVWTPVDERHSDTILKIDWESVISISFREIDREEVFPPEKKPSVDLKNPFKPEEIVTANNNKKYVSLMRATELIRAAAK